MPKIPLDVISAIFENLRNRHQPNPRLINPKYASESLRWIPEATHVCHYWREAAISTRNLWRNINLVASIPWALEFARRSGSSPICIVVQPSQGAVRHPKFYNCLKTLVHENIQRIQRLELLQIDNKERALIKSALSDDAQTPGPGVEPAIYPILEDLKISLHSPVALFPFFLTNGMLRAPELKRLSLASCLVAVDAGPFQNLSQLSISIKPFSNVVNHLHRVLLQMPNLKELFLLPDWKWTFLSNAVYAISQIQPVILPNLRHIEVRGWDIIWISAILKAIAYGPQRCLCINPGQYRGVDQLLSLFTCVMSHATETSLRRLDLTIYPSSLMGLWFRAWQGDLEFDEPDISLVTPLCSKEVFLSRENFEFGTIELLEGLLHRVNYKDLQALNLDIAEVLPNSTWVRLFGSLPSLDSIEVSWSEQELFGALGDGIEDIPTQSKDTNSSAPMVPFQRLKEIKVSRRSAELYTEEEMDFMLKCLRKRLNLGVGLKNLIFYFRGFEDSDDVLSDLKVQLNAFKEVVEVEFEFDEFG